MGVPGRDPGTQPKGGLLTEGVLRPGFSAGGPQGGTAGQTGGRWGCCGVGRWWVELMAKRLRGRGKGRLPGAGGEGNDCSSRRTEGRVTRQVAGVSFGGSTEEKAAGCGWVGVG